MNLLLTNDDGWEAPGLAALVKAAQEFGEVWVVAPAGHMSGISHQITWERPLELFKKSDRVFALDGTPADCVRIGTTQLGVEFDWVLSGVNNGANLGTDIYVSGTVAATREAVLQGIPSIAFSQHRLDITNTFDWSVAQAFATRLIPRFIGESRNLKCLAGRNVNFPDVPVGQVDRIEIVECDLDRKPLPLDFRELEDGRFMSCAIYNQRERTKGMDVATCFGGSVSVTEIGL